MNTQVVQWISAPSGPCMLSCCPVSKLPFHPPLPLYVKALFHKLSKGAFNINLTQDNIFIYLLGTEFFLKTSINSFWWHNFHNVISWLARKWHFPIITFPSGTIMSVPFSLTITLLFKHMLTSQRHIYYFHCLILWKEILSIESVPHNS